jgi:hypothetical protein
MKNSSDTIGKRTRVLPACSAVSQVVMGHELVALLSTFLNSPSVYIKFYVGFGQPRDA